MSEKIEHRAVMILVDAYASTCRAQSYEMCEAELDRLNTNHNREGDVGSVTAVARLRSFGIRDVSERRQTGRHPAILDSAD